MNSTIVVSPRERFSSLVPSLKSLFSTISAEVPVIVVDGATPKDISAELEQLCRQRPFQRITFPYPITPNEARNIGARCAKTQFIVFCDNDIEYENEWLEALEESAITNHADAVAPLIFIGPFDPPKIHHAGGALIAQKVGARVHLKEKHRLMNRDYPDISSSINELAPTSNEVCEFHCTLVRKSFLDRIGGLDERLITREQMDFAMHIKNQNGRATFASNARVTYRAFDPIERIEDLHYFLFRWSDKKVVRSLSAFEQSWQVDPDKKRVRYGWTRRHRRRAVASYHAQLSRVFGAKHIGKILLPFEEVRSRRRFQAALNRATVKSMSKPHPTGKAQEIFDL